MTNTMGVTEGSSSGSALHAGTKMSAFNFIPSGLTRHLARCGISMMFVSVVLAASPGEIGTSARPSANPLSGLPLHFQPLDGQEPVNSYLARGQDYQFLIHPTEFQIVLLRGASAGGDVTDTWDRQQILTDRSILRKALRVGFRGANSQAKMSSEQPMPARFNYLLGPRENWRSGVKTYATVRIHELYPNIDLIYYGNQHQFEYDFTIGPGGDPAAIRMCFSGADRISIGEKGDLVITIGGEDIRQPIPVVYQLSSAERRSVKGGYQQIDEHTIGFQIGAYDRTKPLIIDPVLSYSTSFGGVEGDIAFSVKLDSEGSIYVAGQTLS